jgi:hypothetical protein
MVVATRQKQAQPAARLHRPRRRAILPRLIARIRHCTSALHPRLKRKLVPLHSEFDWLNFWLD